VVEGRDEGASALAVEELPEPDLRAVHDREISSDAGIRVAAPVGRWARSTSVRRVGRL
jgi:hypothetical protein